LVPTLAAPVSDAQERPDVHKEQTRIPCFYVTKVSQTHLVTCRNGEWLRRSFRSARAAEGAYGQEGTSVKAITPLHAKQRMISVGRDTG
jgi:hypothetical protein